MSDLLTAKDVEVKIFKKASFGGYVISEVEEFLNQVADDFEAYSLRSNEQLRRIQELEEALKKHEAMKDMIKDALILAQKSAKDKDSEARLQAEKILEEAHRQATSIIAEAENRIADIDSEVRRRLDEAEKKAQEVTNEARIAGTQILQNAEAARREVKRRVEAVEQEIASRMEKASDEALEITAVARSEARDLLRRADEEMTAHSQGMETLRAEKQKFLRGALALLVNFGQVIDDAQQKLEDDDKKRKNWEDEDEKTEKHSSETLFEMALDGDTKTLPSHERPFSAFNEEGVVSGH